MNSLARQGTLRDVQIISPLSKQISVEWEKTASGEGTECMRFLTLYVCMQEERCIDIVIRWWFWFWFFKVHFYCF